MSSFDVTYYIQVKQTVIANTKKEAKELFLKYKPFKDILEYINLPTAILISEPKKIKENK